METTLTTRAAALTSGANIAAIVEAFANSQDVKNSSRELYTRTVTGFFGWVEETGRAVGSLTLADLIAYKNELLAGGKSSLTVASYCNSVRRFYVPGSQ